MVIIVGEFELKNRNEWYADQGKNGCFTISFLINYNCDYFPDW